MDSASSRTVAKVDMRRCAIASARSSSPSRCGRREYSERNSRPFPETRRPEADVYPGAGDGCGGSVRRRCTNQTLAASVTSFHRRISKPHCFRRVVDRPDAVRPRIAPAGPVVDDRVVGPAIPQRLDHGHELLAAGIAIRVAQLARTAEVARCGRNHDVTMFQATRPLPLQARQEYLAKLTGLRDA
jgi:hypothetical protein